MAEEDNIKVAVRVRPFSQREIDAGVQRIIDMESNTTIIHNPEQRGSEPKKFHFDHSYWSHDGFKEDEQGYNQPASRKYADQVKVFNDLGLGMLRSAWGGYNCSIFAYGQTGSGKSYSIMGYGANKGIVPRICETLFQEIGQNKKEGIEYQVTFSMLEIYNEQVRDLLQKAKRGTAKEGLKIRENQSRGFYVEHLTDVPVATYRDIQLRMDEGNRNRTLAATNMNDRSSRAHTIVTIHFSQNYMRENLTKHAFINLVDLAGSERSKQTGATGDRLEESKNINKSLSELGNIIKGLHDKAQGKRAQLNFRNSKLTMLLKNALGGNSKTIMIAAISPAAENYDQTLSTLRYADRAKSIKTAAKVNESETDKLIRELVAEKERLLKELSDAKAGVTGGYTEDDIQKIKQEQEDEIQKYRKEIQDIQKTWEKRLEEAKKETQTIIIHEQKEENERKKYPHFYNLNEDPALVAKIIHLIKPGVSRIGNNLANPQPEITLNGRSIAKEHAVIHHKKDVIVLHALKGQVRVNGKEAVPQTDILLKHEDRILFGSSNLFVYHHPKEEERLIQSGRKPTKITFDFAMDEIAKYTESGADNDEGDDLLLREEIMSLLPLVEDANYMAEYMGRRVQFEVILMSAIARGKENGTTEVFVKMTNLLNDNEFVWEKNKFLDRQCRMQMIFEEYNGIYSVNKDDDPFYEPGSTPTLIGVTSVPLMAFAHKASYKEKLAIRNYEAKEVGFIGVELKVDGKDGDEDEDEEEKQTPHEPEDLIGRDLKLRVKITRVQNLHQKYSKVWCQFKFYKEKKYSKTSALDGPKPKLEFKYKKVFKYDGKDVVREFLEYLQTSSLLIEVWGHQSETNVPAPRRPRSPRPMDNTRDLEMSRPMTSQGFGMLTGLENCGMDTLKERKDMMGTGTSEACSVQ